MVKIPEGYIVVKERCVDCRRVVYGLVPLNVEVPEPRCDKCESLKNQMM